MKKLSILKSTLCLLMAMLCNVAWAQDVPVKQTSAPEDGYYLMYSENSSGKGWVHYNKSLSERKFRVATDVDLTNGVNANQANYVWKLVNDNENGTFTLQNVGENVFMPADASHGGNMGATTTANLKITAVGGDGNEGIWYVAQTNNKFSGQDLYIHTNTPGGYPNLSYWEGCSLNSTSICAQFYKVHEATYTLEFFSGEEKVATSSLVYPAGIEMSENLISDAVPMGYRFLSYTLNETTYTVQVTPEAFLTVSNLDHGVNYPYTLSEEQETAVFGKELLTIAMDVTMGGTSNDEAFICASDVNETSDNDTYDNTSTFVAVGTQGGRIRLFASAKSSGYYTGNSQLVAARNHKVVIVIDSKNETRKVYVDGVANTANHFQDFYHFRENENAHIYIGGGKNSAGDKYKFSGIVHSVQFFEGALTEDQLSGGIEYPETAGKTILAKAVTTNANMNIYGMQRLLGLVQNAGVGLNGDGQISCNFPANTSQENGNAYDNLLDGEYTTFFHSGYNNPNGNTLGDALHYLQFSLNKPTKIFRFYYKKRSQNNNNRPTKITIQGSNDAQTWNDVSVISSGLPTDGALTDYFSEKITSPKAYRHYRFTINTTNSSAASNGISFFSFSEFYLLPNSDRVNEVFDAVRAYRASATVANAETLNNVWNNGLPIVGEAQYIFANAKQSDGTYAAHYLYNNNGALATSNAPEGDKYAWIAVQPEGTTYYTFQNVSDPTKYISYGNNGNGIGVGNEEQKVQFDIRSSSDFIVHSNSVGLKRIGTDIDGKWMVTAAAGNSFNRNSGKVNDGSWTSDYLFVPANIYDGIRINCAEEFVNGEVYTFVTSLGWMGATAESSNVISTARTNVAAEDKSADNPYFQWTVYKSNNGNYYLYNIGKEMFMGVQSTGNASVTFTENPAGKTLTFKEGNKAGYPILFSTDNKGSVNHSTNFGEGLITWSGGWNDLTDNGNSHQVTLVSQLPAATLQEIANKVEAYDKRLYVATEVDMTENNPNTHFGSVRAISTSGTLATKLKKGEGVVMLDYNGLEETTIDFTRAYRGFEFQGFFLGEENLGKSFTLTEEQEANITEQNPLVAKFTATEAVTLFYDDDEFSYRIPAITTTGTGRIFAVSDYRHNLDDIGRDKHGTGTMRIDLVARYSDNNGETWSEAMTIAAGDNTKTGSYLRAFGDAAIAAVGEKIVVMSAAGDVFYLYGSLENPNRMARIFSTDNGETWSIEEMTTKLYSTQESLLPNVSSAFFGSGKLAVDLNFNNTENARIYGALLVKIGGDNYNNYVVYSDDLGANWKILGGGQNSIADGDEPKVEILPSGQILFSARRQGGRIFNVFTYGTEDGNKADGVGSWSGNTNGCNNGGENGTNGEIFLINAKNVLGEDVKLLLQSQPKGGSNQYDRKDVTIWYKEITDASYTSQQIAGDWIEGLQVSHQKSAYSAMTLQEDGKIGFFFEEAPCFGDDHTKGYSMVYLPLTIEQITKNKYFSLNADFETERSISVVLTDAQGNEYRQQVTSTLGGVATKLSTDYPFITLGDNATLESADGESFIYTNTVTLPFKVSNNETTVWHNIYWPSNGDGATQRYPVYLSASSAEDTSVPKVTEDVQYGSSSYNTDNNADKISWAVYSVNNGFTFKFKNKLTSKFIQATSAADGNAQNVEYVDEANATPFALDHVKEGNRCYGDYALKATIGENAGYLCSTSVGYGYVTHYSGKGHPGAWVKFVEAPDFDALIDEANEVLSWIGEGLGKYTVSESNTAIAETAKTAMQTPNTVKLNDLNTYKNLLEGATLNLPETGKFYYIQSANTNQYLSHIKSTTLTTTAQKSANNIFYFESDRGNTYLVAYENGHYVTNPWNIGVGEAKIPGTNEQYKQSKSFVEGQVGKYALKYFADNGYAYYFFASGTSTNAKQDKSHNEAQWNLEPVISLPFTFKKAALGFATFNAPVAVQLPTGVLAYITDMDETKKVLKMYRLEGNVVPANTPVMLYNEAAKADYAADETTIDLVIVDAYTGDEFGEINNDFYGTIAAETYPDSNAGETVYSLQKNSTSNMVGFYKKASDTTLGGFKAWIKTATSNARAFTIIFDGDDATGLKEALGLENENVEIYDLSGRRLDKPVKGVNVIGGKLVIK